MNSHRPFQETYYQQRVLSSLRFAVIAAFLVRGLLHHRLTMQRSQLSAHYANNFAKKYTKKPRSFDQGKIRDAFNHILGLKPRTLRFNYKAGIIVSHF